MRHDGGIAGALSHLDRGECFSQRTDLIDFDQDRVGAALADPNPQALLVGDEKIVADKLLTGIMQGNESTAMLMAGYIALRMPGAIGVDIDASGEMQNTELLYG